MQFSRYVLHNRNVSVPSGDEGIRTPDPLLARQVLSQLSYTPIGVLLILFFKHGLKWTFPRFAIHLNLWA